MNDPRRFSAAVILFASVMALLGTPALGRGDASEAARLQEQVKKLLKDLGDKNADKQAAAATALLKLGPDVLPLLPDKDPSWTEGQSARVREIRTTLREASARRDLNPRLITFSKDRIPLKDALGELARQTGNTVEIRRRNEDEEPSVKMDLKNATFWQALEAIAKDADLQISYYQKDGKVALVDGPYKAVPVSFSGIFRAIVRRLNLSQGFEADDHTGAITLEIAWEPRFRPLFVENEPEELVVQDGKGTSLKITDSAKGRIPVIKPTAVEKVIRFEAPARTAEKLGLVKGSLSILGPGKTLAFAFDNLGQTGKEGKKLAIDGVAVTLREFSAESDRWTAGLLLEYPDDTPEFESFESWLVNNQVHLEKVSGKGRLAANGGYEIDDQSGHKALIKYRFIDDDETQLGKPADWRLIYHTPGTIVRLSIPFEFRDLPLP
jgi:hypothetical protein